MSAGRPLRVAVLGSSGGWHAERIRGALTERGHSTVPARVTALVGRIDGGVAIGAAAPQRRGGEATGAGAGAARSTTGAAPPVGAAGAIDLGACDAVLVRGLPRGSLEQTILRVDALHVLAAGGVVVVNGAAAIERTVDKLLATALLARAGLPTPRTVACERREDAVAAFEELGGDVILKPLFGSMGHGMARLSDPELARRAFDVLELERAVYYLQEAIEHGGRDVRALVVGGRVVAAIERVGEGWRLNRAAGARARPLELDAERERLCVEAAAALGAEYAGVDLLRDPDGRDLVVEANGIPGWQGLERATGVDVAAALVEHLEELVAGGRRSTDGADG